jgi:hypothetical protein
MDNIVSKDSLIGMALADSEAAHWEASLDEDGYQDTLEADHQTGQHGHLERLVLEAADVLAVYAEEALRFA